MEALFPCIAVRAPSYATQNLSPDKHAMDRIGQERL
jgi:hypothetical protein